MITFLIIIFVLIIIDPSWLSRPTISWCLFISGCLSIWSTPFHLLLVIVTCFMARPLCTLSCWSIHKDPSLVQQTCFLLQLNYYLYTRPWEASMLIVPVHVKCTCEGLLHCMW